MDKHTFVDKEFVFSNPPEPDKKFTFRIDSERYDVKNAVVVSGVYDRKVSGNQRYVVQTTEKNTNKKVFIKMIELISGGPSEQKHAWRELMLGMTLDSENVVKIMDAWLHTEKDENGDFKPKNFYLVTEYLGESLTQLASNQLKRDSKARGPSKLSFELWRKVAFELIKTLIYLKSEGVIHRDIKLNNVVLSDYANPSETKVTLIDFAGARKIIGTNLTRNIMTSGKTAPEIMLNNLDCPPEICKRGDGSHDIFYSFPVDVFTAGQTLLEFIQNKFSDTVKKYAFPKTSFKTGNERIDDIAPFTFFMEQYTELKFSDDEKKDMLKPDANCEMPWVQDEDGENKKEILLKLFKRITEDPKYGYTGNEGDSHSKRFIRGFWFRHLNWTDKQKDDACDLIVKMINYFPNKRATAEDLIRNHNIFKDLGDERNKAFTDLRSYKLLSSSKTPADLSMNDHMLVFQNILRVNAVKFTFDTGIAVKYKQECRLNEDEIISRFYGRDDKENRIQEKFKISTNYEESDSKESDWFGQDAVESIPAINQAFKKDQGIDDAKKLIVGGFRSLAKVKKAGLKLGEYIKAEFGPVNNLKQTKIDVKKHEDDAVDIARGMQEETDRMDGISSKPGPTENQSEEMEDVQQSTSRSNNFRNNDGGESQDDDMNNDGRESQDDDMNDNTDARPNAAWGSTK